MINMRMIQTPSMEERSIFLTLTSLLPITGAYMASASDTTVSIIVSVASPYHTGAQ